MWSEAGPIATHLSNIRYLLYLKSMPAIIERVGLAKVPRSMSTCTAKVAIHLAPQQLNTTVFEVVYLDSHRHIYASVARSSRPSRKHALFDLPEPAR